MAATTFTGSSWDVGTLMLTGYQRVPIETSDAVRTRCQDAFKNVEKIKKFITEITSEIDQSKLPFFIYHPQSDSYYFHENIVAGIWAAQEMVASCYAYMLIEHLENDKNSVIRRATATVVAIGYKRLKCNGADWRLDSKLARGTIIDLSLRPKHLKSTVIDTTSSQKAHSSTLTYAFYLASQSIKNDHIIKNDNTKILLLLRIWMKAVISLKKEEQTSSAFAKRTVEIASEENLVQSAIQIKNALVSAWEEVGLLPKASSPTFIRKHKLTIGWLVVAATALIVFRFVFRR